MRSCRAEFITSTYANGLAGIRRKFLSPSYNLSFCSFRNSYASALHYCYLHSLWGTVLMGFFLSNVYSELKSCSFSKCPIFLFFNVSTLRNSGPSRQCAPAVKSICSGIDVFMRKVVSLYEAMNWLELTIKMGSAMHFTVLYTQKQH